MELTKEEALKKNCPFASRKDISYVCICDKCMAWEWTSFKEESYKCQVINDWDGTISIETRYKYIPIKGKCTLIYNK